MTANKRFHEEMARLRQQSTCGSVLQSNGQTSNLLVQNCKHPDKSNSENRANPLVEGNSAALHSEKETLSTKNRDDELHGKQKPSVVHMEVSQSVHLNPIVNVDAQLVSSLKTALEVIVNENSPTLESITKWANSHSHELDCILKVINIPCRATFSNCHLVDILEKEKIFAAVTSQYVPVCTKGDERMIKVIQPIAGINIPPGEREPLAVAKAAERQWLEILCSSIHVKHGVTNFICMP